jgi:hypothetical protein
LSAWILAGRQRRRPEGVRTGGMSSTTAASMVTSATLAAVTAAVRGSPLPSQTRWSLLPGLPRSTGFAPTWSPHAWPARSSCPRSPATSPTGPPSPAGRGPEVEAVEHPSLGPLGQPTPAGRRRAAAKLAGGQQPPRDRGPGHEHDRSQAGPIRDGAVPVTVGRPRRDRQQGLDQRPQLVRHQLISEGVMARDPARPTPKERKVVLGLQPQSSASCRCGMLGG